MQHQYLSHHLDFQKPLIEYSPQYLNQKEFAHDDDKAGHVLSSMNGKLLRPISSNVPVGLLGIFHRSALRRLSYIHQLRI